MDINSSRFGTLRIQEENIIHFPNGLYGLGRLHDFCLIRHGEAGSFYWLQSVDDPDTAMVVTDPFSAFQTYEVEIPDADADILQAAGSEDLTIYTSVSLAREPARAFTNLLGPIVVNHSARIGMQIIQDSCRYSTRHALAAETAARAA